MVKNLLFFCCILTSILLHAQIPTVNLEASYNFTNGSFIDATNANNFIQTGTSLTKINDRFTNTDRAINLGGDYLSRSDFSFSDLTLSFWVKTNTNDANVRTILNKSLKTGANFSPTEHGMFVYLKDGKVGITARYQQSNAPGGMNTNQSFNFISPKIVTDNNWHHIVIAVDRDYPRVIHSANPIYKLKHTVKIYVDGVVESFIPTNPPNSFRVGVPVNQSTNFIIANNGNGGLSAINKYQDAIDDIYIYTRTLTSAEVVTVGNNAGYCFPPQIADFSMINTTATSTDVVLPAVGGTYDMAYVEDGQPFANAMIVSNINTSFHQLSLQLNKTYNVYLREQCTSGVTSNWSVANQVTTLGQIVYVNPSATGANDGTSWSNAYTTIQVALDAFTTGEIWVKSGTYKPHATDATVKFTITKTNTVLYGGFVGTETSLAQRDFRTNQTIFSGDLLGNDDINIAFANATRSDNSNNIITLTVADNVIIDGFIIEGADTATDGGAINKGVEAEKLTLRNLIIKNNVARNSSAGIKAPLNRTNDRLDIINSKFENNLSTYYTAMYVYFGKTFSQNGYVNIHNTLFANNAIKDEATRKGASGTICLYVNNSGKLYTNIYNNTFVNNRDEGTETGVQKGTIATPRPNGNAGQGFFKAYNSIFWNNLDQNNNPISLYGKVKGFTGTGVSLISSINNIDPKFTDEVNGDYTLKTISPAMNTGDNVHLSNTIITDLVGNARLVGGNVDKGCYENVSGISPYSSLTNLFVNKTATGTKNGISWTNAFTDINEAIQTAKLHGNITQIWIAKGVYTPDVSNRTKSFNIDTPNLTFYGGFAGTEVALVNRNQALIHTTNKTVLSGDLQGNDDANITFANGTRSDNSIHVVKVIEENIILNGLTISDGSFNEASTNNNDKKGGGVFKLETVKTLTIENCVFKNNVSDWAACVTLDYNNTVDRGSYSIDRCVFENNLARHSTTFYALPLTNSKYDLFVTNTLFNGNKTINRSSTVKAYGASAGWIRGYHPGSEVTAKLTNNTYVNNKNLGSVGGDYPVLGASKNNGVANVEIANCIFWDNEKNSNAVAPEVSKVTGTTLANVTVLNSIGTANFSITPIGNKTNVSNTNPLLNSDFTIPETSSAMNSGDNSKLNGTLNKDLSGNTRTIANTVDMGCYENTVGVNPYATITRLYLNASATGSNNGLSWSNAFTNVQYALTIAKSSPSIQEIWVAKGTYTAHASDPDVSIVLDIEGLKLYGGFAGVETTLLGREDAKIHTDNSTVFNGDILGNDTGNPLVGAVTDNTRHIFRITKKDIILDGVTITGAAAHRQPAAYYAGAVWKTDDVETLTIENCVFKNNAARHSAGIYLPYNNTAIRGDFKINRCIFENNISVFGAPFYSSPAANAKFDIVVTNSLFNANKSTNFNSSTVGLRAHGATGGWLVASNTGSEINAKFVNNTYVNGLSNGTQIGGDQAVLGLTQNNGTLTAEVSNSIFWNNKKGGTITKSIGKVTHATLGAVNVFNSTDNDSFSAVPAGNQTNTLNSDPQFMSTSNFNLKTISVLRDSGDNAKIPSGIIKDLLGNTRVLNTTVDRGAYEYDASSQVTIWTGISDSNWNTVGNWTNGVPTATLNGIVPNVVTQYPIIRDVLMAVKNLDIQTGATLGIASGKTLTIEGDLIQNGTFYINSDTSILLNDGSLILKGTQSGSGKVTYNRQVTSDWHLLTSPVAGQSVAAFKSDVAANGVKYAIATYNNTLASSRYNYYTTAAGTNDINTAGDFIKGKGYSVKKATAGTLIFSGDLNTMDVPMAITDGSVTGNKWNLVGNPFTASIYGNVNAHSSNNFLTINAPVLDPTKVAMYVWNGTTSSYDIINQATVSKNLAPGQGFFVESVNGGGTLQFTETMQNHQGNSGSVSRPILGKIPSIRITVSEGKTKKSTEIKYLDNTSIGLDPGYDAGVFSGENTKLNVFTHLVENSKGVDFALQCLPNKNYEAMIIPVGIKAEKGKEITLSAKAVNLSGDTKVYLEDKKNNIFTQLNEENKITWIASENGIGRFYIHTTTRNILDIKETVLENDKTTIYMITENVLRVTGISKGKTKVVVFDTLGREMGTTSFIAKGMNDIQLPVLKTGVYIIRLKTEDGANIKKKVIIE